MQALIYGIQLPPIRHVGKARAGAFPVIRFNVRLFIYRARNRHDFKITWLNIIVK